MKDTNTNINSGTAPVAKGGFFPNIIEADYRAGSFEPPVKAAFWHSGSAAEHVWKDAQRQRQRERR